MSRARSPGPEAVETPNQIPGPLSWTTQSPDQICVFQTDAYLLFGSWSLRYSFERQPDRRARLASGPNNRPPTTAPPSPLFVVPVTSPTWWISPCCVTSAVAPRTGPEYRGVSIQNSHNVTSLVVANTAPRPDSSSRNRELTASNDRTAAWCERDTVIDVATAFTRLLCASRTGERYRSAS